MRLRRRAATFWASSRNYTRDNIGIAVIAMFLLFRLGRNAVMYITHWTFPNNKFQCHKGGLSAPFHRATMQSAKISSAP
jgi:hypothetical protein